MTQVIGFIGGEYRNRTGVHGFAIRRILLILLDFLCGKPLEHAVNATGMCGRAF